MDVLYEHLPHELITFVLVTLFSLLIGLSQRRLSLHREGETTLFGTDRTFTFIGILGYLLYMMDPAGLSVFMGGGLILGILLALNYFVKMTQFHVFGITSIVIGLITYSLAPIVATQPSWFYVLLIVVVLLLTELKDTFTEIAQRMQNHEMITLAKFLAISGIILPMLPNENIIPDIDITPYSVWLATVVVSGISYLSYLLKRYVFRESGVRVSGIIGGMYSSTATISVLARKSKRASDQQVPEYVCAMMLAVSMMFFRFLILIFIFSRQIFSAIYPFLLCMSLVAAAAALYINRRQKALDEADILQEEDTSNPLEFKVALIFAGLYILFTVVTHFTLIYAGTTGLNTLSFLAGLSDVTPFVLNLLQGQAGSIPAHLVAACSMQAIISSITVNMFYAWFFSGRRQAMRRWIFGAFGCVIGVNLLVLLLFYFLY